ncbi:hypothetical protein A1Q1_05335 [Trichosporon asahii var. asahii CBS 2479]|uniref:Uncharacterized protein n=1 Tax=Trichosporon asahii var. asahii (strain ATCC 90039 / CBS 2479 / JCM 2466 / KCTC 7840 / NBRC 103889/ NCYC 2677 / UAMH 7654) TaxID=1186058 RepID=J6EP04_TRIAS|nr:hypothetical protein A1Q1_05335 [Trichosporon asahii var. asahii CBS 2479]EJT46124.1 hypothetical protein A1Q1_05335 [Trichosporon asahii var. asahii CBS 2479]
MLTNQKTPVTVELARLELHDLTLPYQALAKELIPLTRTLPMTLLNLAPITEIFTKFLSQLKGGQDNANSGLESALCLIQALYETCLSEMVQYVPATISEIARVGALRALEPKLVEKAYSTISLVLRTIAPTLLKSDNIEILRETWSSVKGYVVPGSNKAYVRKCIADAWAGVLRKARGDALQRVMHVLLEDSSPGLEAVWANSMKGTQGHLHSRALPIYTVLLDDLVANPTEETTTTMRRVTTALVHHCSSSETAPLVEAVLERLEPKSKAASSKSKNSMDFSSSTAMLTILSTFLYTRKGKRFPSSLFKPTMLKLQSLIPTLKEASTSGKLKEDERVSRGNWRMALVSSIVGSLAASKLAEWLSPGVGLISALWSALDTTEAFAFVNMCIALKWPGVEQFLLAHITKTALGGLESDPLPTLVLLNNLASAGFLTGGLSNVQGGRWRKALVAALTRVLTKLSDSSLDDDDRRLLGQVLKLLPYLAGEASQFVEPLISILGRFVDGSDQEAQENWDEEGVWNNSHVVGRILNSLYGLILRGPKDCSEKVKAFFVDNDFFNVLIHKWHWSREVLEQAAAFIDHWPEAAKLNGDVLDLLEPNLLSADSALRLSSLKILALYSRPISEKSAALWDVCLLVENSEMSLRNVRERTANIARLGRTIQGVQDAGEDLERTVKAAITYLVAQLKVNFRPVWAEAVTALTEVAKSKKEDAESLWTIVWTEIQKTILTEQAIMPDLGVEYPDWTRQRVQDQKDDDDDDEESAEFRCNSLAKGRSATVRAWQETNDTTKLDVAEISGQISKDRLDVISYETQLLAVCTAYPSMVEKHTRVFVPVALAVAGVETDEAQVQLSHLSTRALQTRTIAFLEVCAKFVNPKASYRSSDLHALYINLLSKGEVKIQSIALKCLLTYKSSNLIPYSERLKNLLEESKFRDELTHLNLGIDSEVIEPKHRHEFIDVVIRLLYGIMMSRRARSSTAQGQGARKQAVLTALSGCAPDELKTLVDLMLDPLGGQVDVAPKELETMTIVAPGRQLVGFLSFLQDVLRYLAPQTEQYWSRLIGAVIVIVRQTQEGLDREKAAIEDEGEDVEEKEDDEEDDKEDKGAAPLRALRSTGLKRLVQFLRSRVVEYDFRPFLPSIFKGIISPRLQLLEVENTQAPSGTLDLIAALAASPDTAYSLVEFDDRALPKVFACMTAIKVKPAVIGRVFDVLDSLLFEDEPEVTEKVLMPHVRPLIDHIILLVQNLRASNNEDIMRRLLGILSRLSAVVTDGKQAQQLAALLGPMLKQSGRQVPEKAKVNILITLQRLYSISPDFANPKSEFFNTSYNLICNLLQTLRFPTSRRALIAALQTFAEADKSLARPIEIVADLNAYRVKRMDEPDFDKRLDAFALLCDVPEAELPQTVREWQPILRTSLFFIQEPEELSIRTNAGTMLKRFASLVGDAESGPLVDTMNTVVLPALRRILLSKVELVRNEVLSVFSHAAKTCSGIPVLAEMKPLLGEDDETDVFINLSHIQVHRRARAIRRLRDIVSEGAIRETTLSTIFLPVLEHILTGSTDVTDHHLVNEAITAIGVLAGHLGWTRYNGLIMRFLRLGTPQSKQQKFYIRSVSAIIDNFHFDLKNDAKVGETEEAAVDAAGEGDAEEEATEAAQAVDPEVEAEIKRAEAQAAATERITEVVLNRLLPTLSKFITTKSETEDSVRIPVSLAIVKLASTLPAEESDNEILRIITTVSQILRSKDQDIRDIARDTIGKIAVYLGPSWLVRVLRELRTALQRGPQKHVLAVTTHSILVHATTEAADRFTDLDEAVEDAVEVSAEVIWGESGKDVATEGFKTKMREVRGALSRGNDTFQLVSRLVSPTKISAVLAPVREIMHISQAVKTMQQVDEVLRRIALGLNSNVMMSPEDILNLSYSLINSNSRYLKPKRKEAKAGKSKSDRFTVQMKRNAPEDEDVYPQNAYKFVMFGLELFVTAFRRGKFDFDNVEILARLGPLVSAVGNTLYSPTVPILILGLKATAAVAKCPVPQVEESLPAFVTNIFKIIKHAGGTAETEVAQTALKTLAVLIRDCKATQVSDSQLKYLIEVISPDLEEHERQASIFTVLRAVVSRRFVVPEIYDLMDRVSSIMVTSQSTHVQELCRNVLMQFLLDYPQGQGRLKAQMTFLARNLDYVFESGRVSVMEVLSAVFKRFTPELVAEYGDLFFVALVAVIANDDSEKCRNMAGLLLQQLFGVLDHAHQGRMLDVLKGWIGNTDEGTANVGLGSAALAAYGLLCEADSPAESVFEDLPSVIVPVLDTSARNLLIAETSQIEIELDPALPQQALSAVAKALKVRPEVAGVLPWDTIVELLLFPHDWVRYGAARALALLFAGGRAFELLDGKLLDIARKSCILLGGSKLADGTPVVVDGKLADELVKLLWNISKHWIAARSDKVANGSGEGAEAESDEDEEEEDESEEPDADADEAGETEPTTGAGGEVSWLMSRMSFMSRKLIISRPASNTVLPGQPLPFTGPLQSILRFFAGITQAFTAQQARHYLPHILNPIYRILDEGGDLQGLEGESIDALRKLTIEIRDFVQEKVGTTAFGRTWEQVRRKTFAKRKQRKDFRDQLVIKDPAAWAQRKEKRGANKKESKKRKTNAYMDHKRAKRRM